jgi:hypothetical protein
MNKLSGQKFIHFSGNENRRRNKYFERDEDYLLSHDFNVMGMFFKKNIK